MRVSKGRRAEGPADGGCTLACPPLDDASRRVPSERSAAWRGWASHPKAFAMRSMDMKRISLCLLTLVAAAWTFAPAVAHPLKRSDIILKSAISVDPDAQTVTLPLHRGIAHGKTVWYIITDASNATIARKFGVTFASSIAQAGPAIQHASRLGGLPSFDGAPDFSATRTYDASTDGFPPKHATPGGVGDALYSPFVRIDGIAGVLNAPIIATGNGPFDVTTHTNTEDRVLAIDPKRKTVTLLLVKGFHDGKWVGYLSTDASDPVAASVERATYVPRLAKAPASSAVPIGVIVNGPRSGAHEQGLAFLALNTPLGSDATLANASTLGSSFNVLASFPSVAHPFTENGYSPLWSVEPAVYTSKATVAQKTARITRFSSLLLLANTGAISGPGGAFGPAGFTVNCPVVAILPDSY